MKYLLVTLLFISACVSTHKENMSTQKGQTIDNEMKVSVEKNNKMSTKNFWVLEFSLENTGSDYKRYENIELSLTPAIKDQVKVVVGRDLVGWSEGIQNKLEKDNHNFSVFMAGVTSIAAVSAGLSNDPNYSKAAIGVAAAGAGTLSVDQFIKIRDGVRNSKKSDTRGLIPESHILAAPLSVPPNLFLKRFAVFYIPENLSEQFYKVDLSFTGKDQTSSIKLAATFDTEAVLTECKEIGPSMMMNGFDIRCLQDCERMHPLNQKKCIDNYSRKMKK